MTFQVSAQTKRGGSVGAFVATAREALKKADQFTEDGFSDVVFRGDDGREIAFDEMRELAKP